MAGIINHSAKIKTTGTKRPHTVASNITGAKITISSDKDININAAENHYKDRQYHKETKSGFMGSTSGNTSFISGGATNIRGAQVIGKGSASMQLN